MNINLNNFFLLKKNSIFFKMFFKVFFFIKKNIIILIKLLLAVLLFFFLLDCTNLFCAINVIKFYNFFYIDLIDPIIYFFKNIYINCYIKLNNFSYNYRIKIIKKYYTFTDFSYLQDCIKKKFRYKKKNYISNIKYNYILKPYIFSFFNVIQNTKFYLPFNLNENGFDFLYLSSRSKRKGFNASVTEIYSFKMCKKNIFIHYFGMQKYNYIFNCEERIIKEEEESYENYKDLFYKNYFFILNNSGTFCSNELLNYQHNLNLHYLASYQKEHRVKLINKISINNFRRKNANARVISFENEEFDNTHYYTNRLATLALSDEQRLINFLKAVKRGHRLDDKRTLTFIEKTYDNYFRTGTTVMYLREDSSIFLAKFVSFNDNFFYYIYYTFFEIPFCFKNFLLFYNKEINFINYLKFVKDELFKAEVIYLVIFFYYGFYIISKTLIMNEFSLILAAIYLRRHLLNLLFFGFLFKFKFQNFDTLTSELFFLLYIPGIITFLLIEEYFWWKWKPKHKSKFRILFYFDLCYYGAHCIILAYLIIPLYLQYYLIFKLYIIKFFYYYYRGNDYRLYYIFRNNFKYYLYILYLLIFYDTFIVKEELKILEANIGKNKHQKFYELLHTDVFHINFDMYSRKLLKEQILKNQVSIFLFLKKYIQYFIYYFYMFIFFFGILCMCFKIIINLFFIISLFIINCLNDYDLFILFINKFNYYSYFVRTNLSLILYKEYTIEQADKYHHYLIINNYKTTFLGEFKPKSHIKYKYPGLIFYKTTRLFNGNLHWLILQGGNNYLGEMHYKSTLYNDFFKKQSLYFYKHDLFLINLNKIKKIKNNYCYNKIYFYEINRKFKKSAYQFNFITFKDFKYLTYSTRYLNLFTTNYINRVHLLIRKEYFDYIYEDYLAATCYEDEFGYVTDPTMFPSKLKHRSYNDGSIISGGLHMKKLFLPFYGNNHPFLRQNGSSCIQWMLILNKKKNPTLFNYSFYMNTFNKFYYNKLDIISKNKIYDQFIPSRVDYIKFHFVLTKSLYDYLDYVLTEESLFYKFRQHFKIGSEFNIVFDEDFEVILPPEKPKTLFERFFIYSPKKFNEDEND